jgi:hypothetical protein
VSTLPKIDSTRVDANGTSFIVDCSPSSSKINVMCPNTNIIVKIKRGNVSVNIQMYLADIAL